MKELYDVAIDLEGGKYWYQVKALTEEHAKSIAFGKLALDARHTMWGVRNRVKTCSAIKTAKKQGNNISGNKN